LGGKGSPVREALGAGRNELTLEDGTIIDIHNRSATHAKLKGKKNPPHYYIFLPQRPPPGLGNAFFSSSSSFPLFCRWKKKTGV
jgi:hypothetical protein